MEFIKEFFSHLWTLLVALAVVYPTTVILLLHFFAALYFTKKRPRFTASNLLLFVSPLAILILTAIGSSSRPAEFDPDIVSVFLWVVVLLQVVHAVVIVVTTKASKWVSIAFALNLIWISFAAMFISSVYLIGKR